MKKLVMKALIQQITYVCLKSFAEQGWTLASTKREVFPLQKEKIVLTHKLFANNSNFIQRHLHMYIHRN